jgi:hypothetical protein
VLTPEQIDSFEENGFLVVQDVLTPEQLAEARRLVDGLVENSRRLTESDDLFDLDVGHSAEKPMIARLKNPGNHAPLLLELGRTDAFVDRAWPLIKGPGMLYSGCGRLNMKAAEGGSAVEWHQDTAYGPNTNGDNLTVGLYLDDATTENGCMLMIPGSHKGPALDHHEDGVFVGGIGPGRGADFSAAVPIEVRAGGISIHGPFVVHGSSPNRSSRQRRLLLYGYQSSDQWKLFDGTTEKDLPAEFERRHQKLVRGELTTTINVDSRMLRMPFPKPEQGNLFVIQRSQKERYFK